MTDQQLMAAVGAGDSGATALLVTKYRKRVFKYLLGWVGNREDALDLTQEVMLRICRRASQYNGAAPLTAWIFRVARNLHLDHMRRKNAPVHAGKVELQEEWRLHQSEIPRSPEDDLMSSEIAIRVRRAIEQLPPRQRQVVQLRLLGELSLEEIAAALDLSLGGVKSTLHNAIRQLRARLSDLEMLTNARM